MIKNLLTTAIIALCLSAAGSMYAQSPYIHKVYEYKPAPGQFINKLPEYEEGDNANDMRLKAEEYIANDRQIIVSLGGYGGYIVFGFDHLLKILPVNMTLKFRVMLFGQMPILIRMLQANAAAASRV